MHNSFAVSPRAGATYKVTNNFFVNASWGLYKQSPEILWILADPANKNLKYITADSYILGFEFFPDKAIRLNIEGYYKHYYDYPVSVYDPYYIFINSGLNIYPNFLDRAVSEGKGYVRGIDFSIEKKNDGNGLYGSLLLSYISTKFKALYGSGQRGEFDFGKQMLIMSGYRFNENISFACRMKYSDGKPVTPPLVSPYYDYTQINVLRIPFYLRFDARLDVNFKTGPVNVDTYFEVENLFDKDNYAEGKWNWYWKNWYYYKQWSIVPVVGINVRF
jgi:outer membrane receptor protein involved in Fe transport